MTNLIRRVCVLPCVLGLFACGAEVAPQAPAEPEAKVEQPIEADCGGGPATLPASCAYRDAVCGWGNVVFVAQEVASQATPGCGRVELGVTVAVDLIATDYDEPGEAAAVWACNVLACVPPSTPHIAAAQAACAAGTALANVIRCATATAECAHDIEMATPVGCGGVAGDYPCPYRPSVAACSGGVPRSEGDVTAACGSVVSGYPDVSGPTAGQCVASCVRDTLANAASCGGARDLPEATEDLAEVE
jgi:hypothetical protein